MATKAVSFRLNAGGLPAQLSALSELTERLPEVRDGLLSLFDAGDELFCIDLDRGATALADEVVVRLHPSDALTGLLAAAGAGDIYHLLVEHAASPEVESRDHTTTSRYSQSGARP